MSENEINTLHEKLDELNAAVKEIKVFLLGDLSGKAGLKQEHSKCRNDMCELQDVVSKMNDRLLNVENYKRDIIAWSGGAIFVLMGLWEVIRATIFK